MEQGKQTGKLFIISGPSGTGKGTICKRLAEETGICLSVSMTTRKPRPGEEEGVSYYFTDRERFLQEVENGGFLEYAEVYGNFYGTPRKKVLEKLAQGVDVVLEIDIQGALRVRETFPEGILIFILPPSLAELRRRITERGAESEEAIRLRLSQTMQEVSFVDRYDYCVVNGVLEEAVQKVKAIMAAERARVGLYIHQLIETYKEEV